MANIEQKISKIAQVIYQHPKLIIFIAVVLVYSLSLNNDFVYDDMIIIKKESADMNMSGIRQIFSEPHYPFLPYYRPITRSTFALQKVLFSDQKATAYHVFNILVAGLLGIFIYNLLKLRELQINKKLALLAALFFILHPVTSSSVYPAASGRETMLAVLFMVISLFFYLRDKKSDHTLSVIFFILSLFSKEQAIILPVIFFAADRLVHHNKLTDFKDLAKRYIPFLMVVIIYIFIRYRIFGGQEFLLGNSIMKVVVSPLYALQQIIIPFYELRYEPSSFNAWFSLSRFLLTIGVLFVFLRIWKSQAKQLNSLLIFWISLFMIALLPNSNILSQDASFSERYILFSFVGFTGFAATLFSSLGSSRTIRTFSKILLLLILIFAAVSAHRSVYFKNNLIFTQQWQKTRSDDYLTYYNLARSQEENGDHEAAFENYQKSIELNPSWAPSYLNLGIINYKRNNYKNAIDLFEKHKLLEPTNGKAYYHAGLVYMQTEDYKLAQDQLERAVRLDPDFAEAYMNLGAVYYFQGKTDKAVKITQEAIAKFPKNEQLKQNLEVFKGESGF